VSAGFWEFPTLREEDEFPIFLNADDTHSLQGAIPATKPDSIPWFSIVRNYHPRRTSGEFSSGHRDRCYVALQA
jgi:hypothetical protein